MLFNSSTFIIFFVVVYLLYWFAFKSSVKKQNYLILVSSYIFYGWWDWRFVFLLILSTLIDYYFGLVIENATTKRKLYLWLSIANNLVILGFFKYYNFFAESFQQLAASIGFQTNPYFLSIILPVGISFYTFHGMSYVIDIYYGKSRATRDFTDYAVFVCFFPLLVAGPIERANHLLPQVVKPRSFSYKQSVAGLRIILWGLFKKVVIADSLAAKVDMIFSNPEAFSSLTLVAGVLYFAIQIYCDFSGYSDIAIGVAKLMGFELLVNFRFPYFSRDIAEFWRRWHISLSSWFRDYLYIPLGGSREGLLKAIRNTLIIFVVSGFWHGANWTFIIWGLLHGLYFLPLLIAGKNRKNLGVVAEERMLPSLKELLNMLFTFSIVCFAWIFFRAQTLGDAFEYIRGLFDFSFSIDSGIYPPYLLLLVVFFVIVEWMARRNNIAFLFDTLRMRPVRYAAYYGLLMLIVLYGTFSETAFIYFQF